MCSKNGRRRVGIELTIRTALWAMLLHCDMCIKVV